MFVDREVDEEEESYEPFSPDANPRDTTVIRRKLLDFTEFNNFIEYIVTPESN